MPLAADNSGVNAIELSRPRGASLLLPREGARRGGPGTAVAVARAGPVGSDAADDDAGIEPAALTRGIEAALLRAGLAAYYGVVDGALALLRPSLPGRHVDVRA